MDETKNWSLRMRYREACDYLETVYGIKLKPKTLANRCCEGTGPEVEYFDTLPHCTPAAVDAWVRSHISNTPRPKALPRRAISCAPGAGKHAGRRSSNGATSSATQSAIDEFLAGHAGRVTPP